LASLSYNKSYNIIRQRLDECNQVERLTFDANQKIKEGLQGASIGYLPISFERLKFENRELYNQIKANLDCRRDEARERDRRLAA
jgi:hypothetical protein